MLSFLPVSLVLFYPSRGPGYTILDRLLGNQREREGGGI